MRCSFTIGQAAWLLLGLCLTLYIGDPFNGFVCLFFLFSWIFWQHELMCAEFGIKRRHDSNLSSFTAVLTGKKTAFQLEGEEIRRKIDAGQIDIYIPPHLLARQIKLYKENCRWMTFLESTRQKEFEAYPKDDRAMDTSIPTRYEQKKIDIQNARLARRMARSIARHPITH